MKNVGLIALVLMFGVVAFSATEPSDEKRSRNLSMNNPSANIGIITPQP